jgi:thymidylate kinase
VIALSGVDCAGKSTQRDLLLGHLCALGHEPRTLWTRAGYTPGLETLKRALGFLRGRGKAPRQGISDRPGRYPRRAANLGHPLRRRLWLTAALLDLLWTYGLRIRSWRARGRVVLCDRYLLDCLVDLRVNFPDDRVEERWLCRLLRRVSVRPDAAFCLLVPPGETLARARAKARFHWETPEDLEARWRAYEALAQELAVQPLDGCRPAAEIAQAIQRGLAGCLPGAPGTPPVALEPKRSGR